MHVVANWKMNGLFEPSRNLVEEVAGYVSEHAIAARVVICPPATLIHAVCSWASVMENIAVGAQDCHAQTHGSHTGDISPVMLGDAGAGYVILGHSERRAAHAETDAVVAAKAQAAIDAGLTPIICIGETREQYESNETLAVIEAQALASVPENYRQGVIVAYEPIWSIGTGKIPTLGEIEVVHSAIAAMLSEKKGIAPEEITVLYGGSVNASNAREIMNIPDVGGVLVGTASLNAQEFCEILAASQQ